MTKKEKSKKIKEFKKIERIIQKAFKDSEIYIEKDTSKPNLYL